MKMLKRGETIRMNDGAFHLISDVYGGPSNANEPDWLLVCEREYRNYDQARGRERDGPLSCLMCIALEHDEMQWHADSPYFEDP